MDVTVVTEIPFVGTPEGRVWTDGPFSHRFWRRYLAVFDAVRVVTRVHARERVDPGWLRVDGAGVEVVRLPGSHGALGFARHALAYRRALARSVPDDAAVILRAPCFYFGSMLLGALRRRGQPYGIEVIADPHEVFAPGVVEHPLRPLLRWHFAGALRRQCRSACAAGYVSARVLPQRYPPGPDAFTTDYSSVELTDAAFADAPRPAPRGTEPITLVTVGSLSQLYKGTDVLIDAVAVCVAAGLDLRLVVIGDGRHLEALRRRVEARQIGPRVVFLGRLPGPEAVRAVLDRAALFVLPSRTEGLPRAAIEAMARGLPCLGSTVGGFPDLLPPEDMVPPGDVAALARAIRGVVAAPERMAAMSRRNLVRARDYHDAHLGARRRALYDAVRERTSAWLRGGACSTGHVQEDSGDQRSSAT